MTGIRPAERADLPDVANLYELVARSGRANAPHGLAAYFERTLFDHPWADPEIPSLVYTDEDGTIVAFQGSSVRRAQFDGQAIRIACAGQLVAHPRARRRGAGALLMRAYLHGPQNLTITDGATEEVRQMWTMLGGRPAHLECIEFSRVMRPGRFAAEVILRRRRRRPTGASRLLASAVDAAVTRPASFFEPAAPDGSAEPLTPELLIEHLPLVAGQLRLFPQYDASFLEWLFTELAAVKPRGSPVARLVRARDGRPVGWYVYYLQPGGTSEVLQVAAPDREAGSVLDHLLRDAWVGGASAVRGRVEPRLLEPLARRRCLMRYTGMSLVHSANPDISGAIASGAALLTRLDGEWWMGHHVISF